MSTAAGYFISLLAKERQAGIVTAASVSTQIERLEKEAVALRRLRDECFRVA